MKIIKVIIDMSELNDDMEPDFDIRIPERADYFCSTLSKAFSIIQKVSFERLHLRKYVQARFYAPDSRVEAICEMIDNMTMCQAEIE